MYDVFFMLIIIGVLGFVMFYMTRLTPKSGNKVNGVLRIDHSNPYKDSYMFEIDDIECLQDRKVTKLVLKVDHNADLSHK